MEKYSVNAAFRKEGQPLRVCLLVISPILLLLSFVCLLPSWNITLLERWGGFCLSLLIALLANRRECLLDGDIESSLVRFQPVGDMEALPLPFRLLRKQNRIFIVFFGVLWLLMAFLIFMMFLLIVSAQSRVSPLSIVGFGYALFLSIINFWTQWRAYPQWLELTEEGVRARYNGKETFMRWNEAKVFACYSTGTVAIWYELSNEETLVRWTASIPSIIKTVTTPEIKCSNDELLRKIASVVVAKTGLSLLDLAPTRSRRGGKHAAV